MTDIFIIGDGGCAHAIVWKLRQSSRVGKIYVTPGNAGTDELICANIAINPTNFGELVKFASEKKIGLTIVLSDESLQGGIVDFFKARSLRIFGPMKTATALKSSKEFQHQLMHEAAIPIFDPAEHLEGPDIVMQALCDGISPLMLPLLQHYGKLHDGDQGIETGGMGAVAPVPWLQEDMRHFLEYRVAHAALDTMKKKNIFYTGVLSAGAKITLKGPRVYEWGTQFKDPECQIYMRLLKNDLLDLFDACVDGIVSNIRTDWRLGAVAAVVLTCAEYPDVPKESFPIKGIKDAEQVEEVVVFHAGTKNDGELKTNGARVLTVTAAGPTPKEAIDRVYEAVGRIHFEGMYYRKDIGLTTLKYDSVRM